MNMSSGHIIVAVSIVAAALVISFDDISRATNSNVIPLEGGAIRLGTVHKEQVELNAEVVNSESGRVIFSGSSAVFEADSALRDDMRRNIDDYNKNSSDEDALTMETAGLTESASLEMTASVIYQSEHFPEFTLVVSQRTTELSETASFPEIVDKVDKFEENAKPGIRDSRIIN